MSKSSLFLIVHFVIAGLRLKSQKFDCTTLLIADEVHNLGSEGFITDLPSFSSIIDLVYRQPLFVNMMNREQKPYSRFSAQSFSSSRSKEAIGRCLVEYEYYVHPVELTQDEMDEWYGLTAKIKANTWRQAEWRTQ